MSLIDRVLEKYFSKIPGSYWGIIGGIFGILVFLIAAILHSITEPVTFITHSVSSLGWGPNGSEWVFRIGTIVLGCILVPYGVFLTGFLWVKSGEKHSRIINLLNGLGALSALISVIGLFLVSIFGNVNNQDEFWIHLIGAIVYFFMATIFICLFTLSMILGKKRNKVQITGTMIVLISSLLILISSIPLMLRYSGFNFVLNLIGKNAFQRVDYLAELQATAPFFTLTEWIAVLSTCAWFIITGIYTLKLERK